MLRAPTLSLSEENKCPKCSSVNFDGWGCKDCGYELSDKQKEVHPKKLSEGETKRLKRILGLK